MQRENIFFPLRTQTPSHPSRIDGQKIPCPCHGMLLGNPGFLQEPGYGFLEEITPECTRMDIPPEN